LLYIRATVEEGFALSYRERRRKRGDVVQSASHRVLNVFAPSASAAALLTGGLEQADAG
jgi:hypothetical protein